MGIRIAFFTVLAEGNARCIDEPLRNRRNRGVASRLVDAIIAIPICVAIVVILRPFAEGIDLSIREVRTSGTSGSARKGPTLRWSRLLDAT